MVGLWTLVHLKDLDLSGNPDLVLGDVLASLGGKPWRSSLRELVNERDVEPLHALETVQLGVPPTMQGQGKVRGTVVPRVCGARGFEGAVRMYERECVCV